MAGLKASVFVGWVSQKESPLLTSELAMPFFGPKEAPKASLVALACCWFSQQVLHHIDEFRKKHQN